MPEPAEKPHRWFQFHLSTAVVLMFVAAGLVWANFNKRIYEDMQYHTVVDYGWPMTIYKSSIEPDRNAVWVSTWNFASLGINATTVVATLTAAAFICEWLARRKLSRG